MVTVQITVFSRIFYTDFTHTGFTQGKVSTVLCHSMLSIELLCVKGFVENILLHWLTIKVDGW